eukprot:symbB.v1.2.036057.t1/scaffold5002.1/size31922/2
MSSPQSLLVFAKSADNSLTALAIEAGDILRVEGTRIIGGRVIGDDTTQLRCLLNGMTLASLKAVFTNLGLGVRARARGGGRATMRKDHYVDAIVSNWQTLNERATEVASAVAPNNDMANLLALAGQNDDDDSNTGNAQASGSGDGQEAPATLRPFVGASFKLDDSPDYESMGWLDYVNDPEMEECEADAVLQKRLEKEMPRGYLKDASCFNDEPSDSEIPKIRVSIFKFDGELLFTLDSLDEDCTVYMLKDAILEEIFDRVMKLPADQRKNALKNPLSMDNFVLKHCAIGERMKEGWKLSEYMEEDDDSRHMDVSMDLLLKGGGLIRKHISKSDAVKRLQSKAREYVVADDEGYNFDALPVEIQNLITVHRQKLDAVKLMANQGSNIIQLALMNTPSNTLNEVRQLLEKKFSGRDDTSEHRLAIVIPLLFATLDTLGSASKVLATVHGEMLAYLMGYYAEKYHVMYGVEARFDNKAFIKDIVSEQERRRILQDAGAPVNVENQGNCTLM